MPRALTELELLVLLAILRIGDKAYGVPIAREIDTTAKRIVVRGVVYTTLERLEEQGLVRSRIGEPTPERGGRAKRFFVVTAKGLKAVKDSQRALTAMWRDLPAVNGGLA